MLRFLLYLLKGFCLSVMVVAIASFLVASIIFYNTNPSERTVFSSPVFIALFCGIYYPIVNLPIVAILYKCRFTKVELAVESLVLIFVYCSVQGVIRFFVPSNYLWTHKSGDGIISYSRVWWYNDDFCLIWSICITISLCLLYVKARNFICRSKINHQGSDSK